MSEYHPSDEKYEVVAVLDYDDPKFVGANEYGKAAIRFGKRYANDDVCEFTHDDEPLQDMEVSAQYNTNGNAFELYAFHCRYRNTYSVEYHRAKVMYETLGKIRARMEKLGNEEGWVETFGQFAIRVCRILKVKHTAKYNPEGSYWHFGNAGDIPSCVSYHISDVKRKLGVTEE